MKRRVFLTYICMDFIELCHEVRARGPYYPLLLTPGVAWRREFHETGFWHDNMGRMAIEDKEGILQGQISCFKPSPYMDALEIGYIILRPESRGKGYMSETIRLFTSYLFDLHKINRIQLTVMVGNEGSRHVAMKCGFKSEGILSQAMYREGRFIGIEMFSLLRDERPK